jgi:hypothetical protein
MDMAGVDVGTSDVGTVTNAVPMDDGADCWYMPKSGATGRVTVTLLSSEEVAKNWRSRMDDLAASGDQEDGARTSSLTRVAGTAALQEAQQTNGSASCHVTALVSDTAVASADIGVSSSSGSEAMCTVATDVLKTVVERLPEAG